MGNKIKVRRQFAALPVRRGEAGLEVLLITSRETGRWIIPKGWPQKGRRGRTVVAREAREEAGVVGRVAKNPIGRYRYEKGLAGGEIVLCEVKVFPLRVAREHDAWPERADRRRRWFSLESATVQVGDADLRTLLAAYAQTLEGAPDRPRPEAAAHVG